MNTKPIPSSTYRLQFHDSFTFADAQAIVPYLHELGIGAVYASPVFKARKASGHGYDVVDPLDINPAIGGCEALEHLSSYVRSHDMGWIQDIVPNHMAFDKDNKMLMDILEHGPNSRFFSFFDIDWDHPYQHMKKRLLTPFLGDTYERVLQRGELSLRYSDQTLYVCYYDHWYPLRPQSYGEVFAQSEQQLMEAFGDQVPLRISLVGALHFLASVEDIALEQGRAEKLAHAKQILNQLYHMHPEVQGYMDSCLQYFNSAAQDAEALLVLDHLLQMQHFRMSFWKVAAEEINYRRFFSVNDLICLNIYKKDVFEYTHSLLKKYLHQGVFTGLRVDHIDGLHDPKSYLTNLSSLAENRYTVVEKILCGTEQLRSDWPVDGTSGYEFLAQTAAFFVDESAHSALDRLYISFTGQRQSFASLLLSKKRLIAEKHMAGNIDNVAHHMKQITGKDPLGRDITLYALRRAIVEFMVAFDVYRSYVTTDEFDRQDREVFLRALDQARKNAPDLMYEFDFISAFFIDELGGGQQLGAIRELLMHFQQHTGPLMAKGCEDTAFYIYNRFVARNEVGDEPEVFSISAQQMHQWYAQRAKQWPASMNATATHDTKRGEDVRMRLLLLSEVHEQWAKKVAYWHTLNIDAKTGSAPDTNDEYLLYQTLVGTLDFSYSDPLAAPHYTQRMCEYMIKAVREAKRHTAWIKPDEAYESACVNFVKHLLDPQKSKQFLADLLQFSRPIAFWGSSNSLAYLTLKCTAPGIPDMYQGSELWDLSLVDPDNRRPVAFDQRREFLQQIKTGQISLEQMRNQWQNGQIKLLLVYRLMQLRKQFSSVFLDGAYIPVRVEGAKKEHMFVFCRQNADTLILVAVTRLPAKITGEQQSYALGSSVWGDTHCVVPQEYAVSKLQGIDGRQVACNQQGVVMARDLFAHLPVAVATAQLKSV